MNVTHVNGSFRANENKAIFSYFCSSAAENRDLGQCWCNYSFDDDDYDYDDVVLPYPYYILP